MCWPRLSGSSGLAIQRACPSGTTSRSSRSLRRRLSDDEVVAVATELISTGGAPVQGTDVRVAISKLTDELPSPQDTERVKRRLAAVGWPVSDPFGSPA